MTTPTDPRGTGSTSAGSTGTTGNRPVALITGATSGIGDAFARNLAGQGFRLILVARDAARLAGRRSVLLALGAPEVETVAADLSTDAGIDTVAELLAGSRVDVLVNNAGKGLAKDFLDSSDAELMELLDLNVTAVLRLTRAALPGMVKRGFGGIINVASIAGVVPGRGGTYGASKAWVIAFSEAMHMEYAPAGVRVQALCPGFVRTEFHERAGIDMEGTPGWMYVDADKLVVTSLADLRLGRPVSIPGALYRTVAAGAKVLPRSLIRSLAMRVGWKPAAPDGPAGTGPADTGFAGTDVADTGVADTQPAAGLRRRPAD